MRSLVERFLAEAPVKRIQTKSLEDYLIKRLTLQGYWQRAVTSASPSLLHSSSKKTASGPLRHGKAMV